MSRDYLAKDPKGAVVAFNEAAQAMESGDEEGAVASWRRALELDPGLIQAALNLITYHQQQDDLRGELDLWDWVLGFDPFHTDHLILQAGALRKSGELNRAIENYLRAIAIYPYFKFWYQELATVYRKLGREQDGEIWDSRGAALDADTAELCYEDGVRHAKEKRWDSARRLPGQSRCEAATLGGAGARRIAR